jgi:hypothetical protein
VIRPIALAALVLFAAACVSSGASGGVAPLDEAVEGLCRATDLARGGDVAGASGVFQDRSHEYLHVLADDLMDVDRAAAARLLEAKQRVEAAFGDPGSADPEGTAALLSDLQSALAEAATAAGLDPSSCGEDAA